MNRIQAERYVIGMLLIKETFLKDCHLYPCNFTTPQYRVIINALNSIPIEKLDTQTLINYLSINNQLEEAGGIIEIVGLQDTLTDKNTLNKLHTLSNLLRNIPGDFTYYEQ